VRGKRLPSDDPETIARHEGFSAWRSEASVRALAARFPRIGAHIAELDLPHDMTAWPFASNPTHVTVVGDPDVVLSRVVRVIPV